MNCELAHLDGAYMLGALAPAERQAFARHLAGCDPCARSVRELAGLPGLLGRVHASALEDEPGVPLPDTLLPALLRETRRAERRRLLTAAGLAAVAAVVVGALVTYGVVGGAPAPGSEAGGPVPSATATATTEPAPTALEMTAVRGAPVSGELVLENVAWGTRLGLTCTYRGVGVDGGGATYILLVRTTDGRTEQVGTWLALPGRTMQLAAGTAEHRDDIEAVEVRLSTGLKVLELTI